MIPAVVVLTRTFRERAVRQPRTEQEGLTAPGRRRFRSSQSLHQLLHQAEHAEDQHREHDVNQDTHLVSIRWIFAAAVGPHQGRRPRGPRRRGPTRKLDPPPRAGTSVDGFLTPIGCTFTAFVGPRHIVAGASCHAARPVIGNGRQETAPRQVKRYAVGQAAVRRFNSP